MQAKKSTSGVSSSDIMGSKRATSGGAYSTIESCDSANSWCKRQWGENKLSNHIFDIYMYGFMSKILAIAFNLARPEIELLLINNTIC